MEGQETLCNSFLEALDGKLTIVVEGALTIDGGVDAATLSSRLAKIHNHGMITCRTDLIGILQLRMSIKEGVIEPTPKAQEEKPGREFSIGNANYLAL